MPFGGLLIAGAGLAYGAVNGAIQNHKANKIAEGLKDPTYQIPDEFKQNREIARQMAQRGLPQQQYNNAVNGIAQNNAAGLATLSRSANPGAGVTSLTRQADNARAGLDASDAAARENNQRFFINQNGVVGNQQLAKQQADVYDKYTRDFNQMQAYRGAAQDNINNAVSGAQNLGMTYLNSQSGNPTSVGGTSQPWGGLGPYKPQGYTLPNYMAVGNPSTKATPQTIGEKIAPTPVPVSPHITPNIPATHPQYFGANWHFNPLVGGKQYGLPYTWGQQ